MLQEKRASYCRINFKWLTIIIVIIGFAFVAAPIFIGVKNRDVVVEDDPYKAGLAYDETVKKYSQLGWKIQCPDKVKAGSSAIVIRITDSRGDGVEVDAVEFLLQKIGNPEVVNYKASYEGKGRYSALAGFDKDGYWDMRIKVTIKADTYKFDRRIYAETGR